MAAAIREIHAIEKHMQELGEKFQAQQKGTPPPIPTIF